MAWEYLDNELYYQRYIQVMHLVDKGDIVVDLNSGNSGFSECVLKQNAFYISNDKFNSEALLNVTDDVMSSMLHKVNIITCFGIGGYEISKSNLESPTITNTIISMSKKFKPRVVIIESIRKYSSIQDRIIKELEELYYKEAQFNNMWGDYTGDRYTTVLIKK